MSFNSYNPKGDTNLSNEESELIDKVFGKYSSTESDTECDSGSSSKSSKSSKDKSKSKHDKSKSSKSKKCKDKKDKDGYYDCSYWTIVIAIILTLIFFILACPAADIFFSTHVPDPWFNWITRGLIFFFFAFIILIIFDYNYYDPKHSKYEDDC